jgi:hypothetical protein
MHKVSGYTSFFRGLRPHGQVILASLGGPTNSVVVDMDGTIPTLKPSCYTKLGDEGAVPAIRIAALVDAFRYGRPLNDTICSVSDSTMFKALGQLIVERLQVK